MGQKNRLEQIPSIRMIDERPVLRGMHRWSYPWAHMQPGDAFVLDDPSRRARSAMTAAAAQWSRRTGARFATGEDWSEVDGQRQHTGWWCARIDGVEVLPPEPTWRQEADIQARLNRAQARRDARAARGATARVRRQKIEPVLPLVTATEWSQPVAAPEVYADWDKPREPGEVF